MKEVELTTTVGADGHEVEFSVTTVNWDDPEEYYASLREIKPEITDEECIRSLMDVVNSQQNQGAMQTKKSPIRDAIREEGGVDGPKVAEAIKDAQDWAPTYVVSGGARGRIAGVTKTKAGEVGKALLEADPEQLKALAAQMGINLD